MIVKNLALVFPGQGSQTVGMGRDISQSKPEARRTFAEADEALGFPLSRLCFEGPEDELRRTENAQPAILAASIAIFRSLGAEMALTPDYVAGHSLGEYSALVAAGAMRFADAVLLLRRRGQLMAAAGGAGEGAMAAVLGLDDGALPTVVEAARTAGLVEVANYNCPGQVVVAGERPAVEEAGRLAQEAGAKKVVYLQVSGAFHSSMMRPAAEEFAHELEKVELHRPRVPVVANVTARPVTEPGDIKRLLAEQITSPVRWEASMRYLLGAGVRDLLELGPGKVLSGLMRRIDRGIRTASVYDETSLKETLAFYGEV